MCVTCCRESALIGEVELDDLFKSLPTPVILCNSVLPLAVSHAMLEVHLCQILPN